MPPHVYVLGLMIEPQYWRLLRLHALPEWTIYDVCMTDVWSPVGTVQSSVVLCWWAGMCSHWGEERGTKDTHSFSRLFHAQGENYFASMHLICLKWFIFNSGKQLSGLLLEVLGPNAVPAHKHSWYFNFNELYSIFQRNWNTLHRPSSLNII